MEKLAQHHPLSGFRHTQSARPGIVYLFFRRASNSFKSLFLSRSNSIAPATLAIMIQCTALILVCASSWAIYWLAAASFDADISFSLWMLILMQAVTATLLAQIVKMASWWRWIHFGFPLAVYAMSHWQIPSEVYLVGFIISLSLFWTTFRTQVPFYPSRPAVWRQLAHLMPHDKAMRMIDIGSGLGDMSMYIAKVRPASHVEGIEIAPLPWLVSHIRALLTRSSARFTLGNYQVLDFAHYDIIFAYLSPAAMLALWQKASNEMRPGSMLVSLEFEIPGITPSAVIEGAGQSPVMYVWHIA